MRRSTGGGASRVRISAGKWKGRAIDVPPGARPTSSRAREALFDLVADRLPGARVLDLYAGSGSVGLEAISRGAAAAVLVEPRAEALSRTLERLDVEPDAVRVLSSGAAAALRHLASRSETFELIFCDPPYEQDPGPAIGPLLAAVAAPGATVVFQTDAGEPPPRLEGFSVVGRRAYGRNVFHFLAPENARRL